jgi:hemolysin activation/secretion protein
MVRRIRRVALICAVSGFVLAQSTAHAQVIAPSQLTPQSLRPETRPYDNPMSARGPSAITMPQGDNHLTVLINHVDVEGAFAELAPATEKFKDRIAGRRVSVAEIYEAAADLEQIYAAAGYPLVRVAVPSQKLVDQGRLRFVVVDGFIEAIDVDRVPSQVRRPVAARTHALLGQRHLKRAAIERAVLVAGSVSGFRLRSTLERGNQEGGVRLILEGEYRWVSAAVSIDDRLPRNLGTWQLHGSVALNSAFGAGEQIYATVGLGANLVAASEGRSPLAIYGGGVVIPLGTDGLTINPEYTHSITITNQRADVPASLGDFDRVALRLRAPIDLTRKTSLYANFSLEEIDQELAAPDFGVALNHDHYAAFRAGPDYATTLPWGAGVQAGAIASIGLGGRSALDAAASGIPLSRIGASPEFVKFNVSAHLSQPLAAGLRLDLATTGQFTGGTPMMRPEQISLDGNDALSAFPFGTFNADQGVTLRGELSRPYVFGAGAFNLTASPYVFGAAGHGWLANATRVEQAAFDAAAIGIGIRSGVDTAGWPAATLALEVARGFTDLAGVRQGTRINLVAATAF